MSRSTRAARQTTRLAKGIVLFRESFLFLEIEFMSSDEAATVIGRMMLERKTLYQREVALAEELRSFGEGLGILGRKLRSNAKPLDDAEIRLLDASLISGLVD